MAPFGERMRREREMRGITLEAISEKTKITIRTLQALEKDEFDKLPGGIFNKGFVRSYAQFLGMNEEQVLKDFIAVAGDPEQPLPDPPVKHQEIIPQPKEKRSWTGVAAVVVAAVMLLGVGWKVASKVSRAADAAWTRAHKEKSASTYHSSAAFAASSPSSDSPQPNQADIAPATQDKPLTPAVQTDATNPILQPATQTTNAATASPQLVPASATTPRSDRFVILVKAIRPAWVSITADGKPVIEGVLKRKKKIRAYSQVVLKTNNAGALAIARNGQPLAALGHEDQQTTVTFTPDGITR
jgi:cytoskeleton protein RodZ